MIIIQHNIAIIEILPVGLRGRPAGIRSSGLPVHKFKKTKIWNDNISDNIKLLPLKNSNKKI